eukprot:scaffold255283_cov67-Attheya_sp.AAC.4
MKHHQQHAREHNNKNNRFDDGGDSIIAVSGKTRKPEKLHRTAFDWHDFYSADWDPETDFDGDTEQRIKKDFPDFNKLEMKKLFYAWVVGTKRGLKFTDSFVSKVRKKRKAKKDTEEENKRMKTEPSQMSASTFTSDTKHILEGVGSMPPYVYQHIMIPSQLKRRFLNILDSQPIENREHGIGTEQVMRGGVHTKIKE